IRRCASRGVPWENSLFKRGLENTHSPCARTVRSNRVNSQFRSSTSRLSNLGLECLPLAHVPAISLACRIARFACLPAAARECLHILACCTPSALHHHREDRTPRGHHKTIG
ncbi:hypothetical protein DBV15_11688, partial [Temnothorax longispinosus]